MKVKKLKNPFIFWLPPGLCCRNLAIVFEKTKFCKLGSFFHKNILYVPKSCFLRSKYVKTCHQRKNTVSC